MHPDAISYLQREARRLEPSFVLEFGSGSSTLWLAQLMRDLHGDEDGVRVFSIEQDEQTSVSVLNSLADEGLDRTVRILFAPLKETTVWGQRFRGYDLGPEDLSTLLGSAVPDLIVVDGPASDPGARFGTLPWVIDHVAPGARFYLDDALRSGELWAAARWAESGRIDIAGVHLIGRGLLSGRLVT